MFTRTLAGPEKFLHAPSPSTPVAPLSRVKEAPLRAHVVNMCVTAEEPAKCYLCECLEFSGRGMKTKYLPLLRQFAETPIIHRTPENDALFAPLVSLGVIYPTLSHCWRVSPTGEMALADGKKRVARTR